MVTMKSQVSKMLIVRSRVSEILTNDLDVHINGSFWRHSQIASAMPQVDKCFDVLSMSLTYLKVVTASWLFSFLFFLDFKRRLTTWLVFSSSRETISQSGTKLLTTLFGLDTSPLSSGSLGLSRTTVSWLSRYNEISFYKPNLGLFCS